ncbi:helix-turn-helix domain-containing protein [Leptospira congkakensis]|uniref:helix-turn-helix domain-containing protein n=1 Tax=Leptospira congkakensis TaxID=2484932 RepID=UPI003CC6562A
MEYGEFVRKLGQRIKEIRISKGITQEAMEEGEYGISYRTVQDIENGQSHPSIRSIFKISKQLEVEPHKLMLFDDAKAKRRHKLTEKESELLHSYFKKAELIRNLINDKSINQNIEKDELLLYLNLWFNFLYIVIETAIFQFEIKDKTFDSLYNFKTHSWTNEFISKLKDSNQSIGSIQSDSNIQFKELEQLVIYASYLHSTISLFFKGDKKIEIISTENFKFESILIKKLIGNGKVEK